jgi:phosphate-selective porin OprO/OprP
VALRYSYADLTDEDVTGGIGEAVTFGLNWHWNTNARMQFNYLYGHIDQRGPIDGFTAGDYSIFGTRLMVDF